MYITKVLSYNDAWEKLLNNYKDEFNELKNILEFNEKLIIKTHISNKYRPSEKSTYSLFFLIRKNIEQELEKSKWINCFNTAIEKNSKKMGFIKGEVSIKFAENEETLLNWVYNLIPRSKIILGINMPIAMAFNLESSEFVKNKYRIIKNGLSYNNSFNMINDYLTDDILIRQESSFLIFGLGFEPEDIEIIKIKTKPESLMIERSITFEPEYFQAGLGLMSYFGTVMRKKYPDQKAKVKIEQDGLKVRLIVETENGDQEIIEHALEEYGLIISGQQSPNDFFKSQYDNIELRSELRAAKNKIEDQRELLSYKDAEISRLERLFSQSFTRPVPAIHITNQLSNTQNNSINLKTEVNQTYEQLDRLIDLSDNTDMKSRLRDLQNALEQIKNNDNPEDVKDSGAMKKLNKFLNEANETGTEAKGLVEKGGEALELIKKLGRGYNSIAEWCALPVIPSVFVKE